MLDDAQQASFANLSEEELQKAVSDTATSIYQEILAQPKLAALIEALPETFDSNELWSMVYSRTEEVAREAHQEGQAEELQKAVSDTATSIYQEILAQPKLAALIEALPESFDSNELWSVILAQTEAAAERTF